MPYKDVEKQRQARRESHDRLQDKIRERNRATRVAVKQRVRQEKEKPCADCGIQYPYYVMQFDHVLGVKEGEISQFMSNRQLKKALAEVEKCDVVCANCHAERTFQRQPIGEEHPNYVRGKDAA